MEEYILLIDTEDAKGLVYNISKVLFANNLNIEQNAEYVDEDTKKFFMRSIISGKVSKNFAKRIKRSFTQWCKNNFK
jgi:formyltetrahydrofolate deformylase